MRADVESKRAGGMREREREREGEGRKESRGHERGGKTERGRESKA